MSDLPIQRDNTEKFVLIRYKITLWHLNAEILRQIALSKQFRIFFFGAVLIILSFFRINSVIFNRKVLLRQQLAVLKNVFFSPVDGKARRLRSYCSFRSVNLFRNFAAQIRFCLAARPYIRQTCANVCRKQILFTSPEDKNRQNNEIDAVFTV